MFLLADVFFLPIYMVMNTFRILLCLSCPIITLSHLKSSIQRESTSPREMILRLSTWLSVIIRLNLRVLLARGFSSFEGHSHHQTPFFALTVTTSLSHADPVLSLTIVLLFSLTRLHTPFILSIHTIFFNISGWPG